MDSSEPEKDNEQEQGHGVTIHIHSPDNRIAARDYIEVNIHVGEKAGRKRADQANGVSAGALGQPEVRQLLESAIQEILFSPGGAQRLQTARRLSNAPVGK